MFAILLWSTLALMTTYANGIPPFQLLSMCFFIVFVSNLCVQPKKVKQVLRSNRQAWPVWLLNCVGLFGYHFFYFIALDHAPPIQAGLIAYL
jgi:drug/metabolite transporter (DMT)-like permease